MLWSWVILAQFQSSGANPATCTEDASALRINRDHWEGAQLIPSLSTGSLPSYAHHCAEPAAGPQMRCHWLQMTYNPSPALLASNHAVLCCQSRHADLVSQAGPPELMMAFLLINHPFVLSQQHPPHSVLLHQQQGRH